MATNRRPSVPPKSSSEAPHDEIVEEIHAHRAELAAKFDYDMERLFRYYQQMEGQNPARRAPESVPARPAK
jgi:hypothetical protein